MMVSAISFFINKSILKYSIYTKVLAEQGTLSSIENKDKNVLRRIRLKYLLEKDFVLLHPEDTPKSRSSEIIHTHRNIFPVVNASGILVGILHSDQLLELLINPDASMAMQLIGNIMQPPNKVIEIDTPMSEVMQIMDSLDTRILPVINKNGLYLGFVSKNGIFNKYRLLLVRQGGYMQN